MYEAAARMEADAPANKLSQHRLKLTEGGMLKVQGGEGLRILAIEGRLWIIQEDDVCDYELEAGQSLCIGRGGITLIQAMTGATFALQSPLQHGAAPARFSVVGAAAREPSPA
jgi:hypothetical protein